MRLIIINLTDKIVPITRTNLQKVNLPPHQPYVLDTLHNPEIKFWQNCTDPRFKIISNPTEIDRYLKVVSNRDKTKIATEKIETKQTAPSTVKSEPIYNNVETTNIKNVSAVSTDNTKVTESVVEIVDNNINEKSNDVTEDVENVSNVSNTKYSADELIGKKVVELKTIASELGIDLPNNVNKATIIDLIVKNQ